MSDYLFLIPIALFLMVGVVSPGPSFILVAQTAMAKSRAQGLYAALGMGVGAAIFAAVASMGLFVLLDSVPWLYLMLKIAGGSYLCFLAFKMWRGASTPSEVTDASGATHEKTANAFLLGLFTQLSNPKTAIVFASAFAAFLPASVPTGAFAIICGLAFIIDAGWYMLVAATLSTRRAQRVYAGAKTTINRVASGVVGAMGVKLLASDL